MADIDKGLLLRLEATTLLLTKQLREASGEVQQFADKSNRAITVSSAQQQNAVKNLGFQFNDFLVQVQGGTPILRAFAQQSGQAAGALADMGGKAGVAGRFFSGILGGSILSVGTILASYILTMDDANEALDLAKVGSTGLSEAQSALGDMFDLVSGKLKNQNELLRANAQLTALNLRSEAGAAKASSGKALGNAGELSAFPFFYKPGSNADQFAVIDAFQKKLITAREALSRLSTVSDKGLKVSNRELQQAIIDSLAAVEKEKIADLIDQSLDSGKLAPGLRREGRERKGRKPSDADTFARSMGFADNKAYQAWLDSGKQALDDADRARNPFPAVRAGSDKFEANLSGALGKAREQLVGLKVEMVDVSTATTRLFEALSYEAEHINEAFAQIEADGLRSLEDGLTDVIAGTVSVADAFSSMANQIIADLIRIAVRQAIIKPLASAFGFGIPGFADGGDPPVGMPFLVGEHGPEIMMTKGPTTVIPNHEIGRFGGGRSLTVHVDARGASDPAMVKRMVEQGIMAAAPALISAAESRTKIGLSRPRLPGALG